MKVKKEYECDECYDTGCRCGGIGLSCHGCCTCAAGQRARDNRKKALEEIVAILTYFNKK